MWVFIYEHVNKFIVVLYWLLFSNQPHIKKLSIKFHRRNEEIEVGTSQIQTPASKDKGFEGLNLCFAASTFGVNGTVP